MVVTNPVTQIGLNVCLSKRFYLIIYGVFFKVILKYNSRKPLLRQTKLYLEQRFSGVCRQKYLLSSDLMFLKNLLFELIYVKVLSNFLI